jgi:A/G-specific adenine glycosylase
MSDSLFQKDLLTWYLKHRRDLPWRRTKNPYAIWVSEIMLQQTTVATVIPYYEKFLKRFPTVKTLAEAPEEEVLKYWSGLGYYSRARNLQKAAKIILSGPVASGAFCRRDLTAVRKSPSHHPTVAELLQLPGIGRYTAGAIASIAFDQKAPIVDGNVIRVLSRIFKIGEDPKSSEGQKVFWKKAEEVLPEKHCGDFNQALMELGATICLPENPLCLVCPVSALCKGKKETGKYPKAKKKTDYRDVLMTAAVIVKEEGKIRKILMIQRPQKGLLKGMWEIPMVEGDLEALVKKWPLQIDSALPLVRHSVLNRRLKIRPVVARLQEPIAENHRWITSVADLPTSSMNKKILVEYINQKD